MPKTERCAWCCEDYPVKEIILNDLGYRTCNGCWDRYLEDGSTPSTAPKLRDDCRDDQS